MFQRGDQLLYGVHGVCKIIEIERQKTGGKITEYYVLEPVNQTGTRFYVPTQNEAAVAKLRPILSREEWHAILQSPDVRNGTWIQDENQRKQSYIRLITGGDRVALVRMVHTLHKHKQAQIALGRRLHMCDENFLRDAEKLLASEFSLVMDIRPSEVGTYIQNILCD